MARILVNVEGETEETFVNALLAPHLLAYGHYVSARKMGNGRARAKRGGVTPWLPARHDIVLHLKQDPNLYVTTMVDYYAMPAGEDVGWPGRSAARALAFANKAPHIVAAISADVAGTMGSAHIHGRFIPFVLMHEFEALLFSDPAGFAEGIERKELAPKFQAIRDAFGSPEEINDSPHTSPSHRIKDFLGENYQKEFLGNLAALHIGLDTMRAACPLLNAWVATLEALP